MPRGCKTLTFSNFSDIYKTIMFNRIVLFLKESRQELQRVNWPTRQETVRLTIIVVGVSLFTAVFLGLVDFALAAILEKFLI